MSESGDYTPAPYWTGHNFSEAKDSYRTYQARRYRAPTPAPAPAPTPSKSKKVVATVAPTPAPALTVNIPNKLVCLTEAALIVGIDLTSSMDDWPLPFFSKMPYIDHEVQSYLGKSVSVSFCGFGDAYSDKYPLQPQPFVEGVGMKDSLQKLIHEGMQPGGSGGIGTNESPDLMALYYLKNAEFPNATRKPIMVFVTDEGFYSFVKREQAKEYAKYNFAKDERISPKALFFELTQKFNVYVVRKPYNCSKLSKTDNDEIDKKIEAMWVGVLGQDHVIPLPEANRVVDVLFGILAHETGQFKEFEKELKDRQLKDKNGQHKVNVVMRALKTMHFSKDDLANTKTRSLRDDDEVPTGRKPTLDFH